MRLGRSGRRSLFSSLPLVPSRSFIMSLTPPLAFSSLSAINVPTLFINPTADVLGESVSLSPFSPPPLSIICFLFPSLTAYTLLFSLRPMMGEMKKNIPNLTIRVSVTSMLLLRR